MANGPYPNRVKEWRLRRQLTQAQVGEALGIHQKNVGELEKGKTRLTADKLAKLADLFRCEAADLLPGDPDPALQPHAQLSFTDEAGDDDSEFLGDIVEAFDALYKHEGVRISLRELVILAEETRDDLVAQAKTAADRRSLLEAELRRARRYIKQQRIRELVSRERRPQH